MVNAGRLPSEIFNGKLMKRWPRVFVYSMIRSEGVNPMMLLTEVHAMQFFTHTSDIGLTTT